jgi:hypothetical protein
MVKVSKEPNESPHSISSSEDLVGVKVNARRAIKAVRAKANVKGSGSLASMTS